MKRFWICFLLSVVLCLSLALPCFAEEAPSRLVDEGDLLTDSEELMVVSELDRISETWGMDFVIVIPKTLDGASEQAFADDYFDYGGYRYDGALLLLCPWEDARYLSTCGEAIDVIELDAIREGVLSYYEDGDYFTACMGFARLLAARIPPANTPANSERYTSLVISARPMASTGGISDHTVPNTPVSTPAALVVATNSSATATAA